GKLSHGIGIYTPRSLGTSRDAESACAAGITENKGDLLSIGERPVMHHWETRGRRFKSSRSDQEKPRISGAFCISGALMRIEQMPNKPIKTTGMRQKPPE